MSTYIDKGPVSLVERKKQQWAKEREELAGLWGPWGPADERPFGRSRYESKLSMVPNAEYTRRDSNRRSSLPPLYKNQYNSNDRYEREKDLGGETSGYGSDNPNNPQWNQSGYESSSSFRDDRPRWGDKGVGVGKYWQPKQESFEKITANDPPNWVKRGLQDGEIVVSNTSPAESPQQSYEEQERPYTGSSFSQNRTYIRGQNIPLDSVELAERERRRQVAMAHQEAIRQQLEERERKRMEEKERRIREEREEEIRIEREQEIERQRQEAEQRQIREKQERERKRKEAIEQAMEIAEKEAKLEKMKQKMMKQMTNNIIQMNMTENIKDKEKILNNFEEVQNCKNSDINDNYVDEKQSNIDQDNISTSPSAKSEILNNELNNNCELKYKMLNTPRESFNNEPPTTNTNNNNSNNNNTAERSLTPLPPSSRAGSNYSLVFPNSLENVQNVQYAILMPTSTIPIAVPIAIANPERSPSSIRTENRILTPTFFRHKNKILCDSSTQTENCDYRLECCENREKYIREKLTNLELSYDNRSRKDRRSRNEDRRCESMEERPKWGANRPPTRYLKQSEKDPLYQRRKLRQKSRESKMYDDKNSSDESQTGTPRSYRKKGYIEKRHSRALWRKNDEVFSRNIRMYQTEIVPLESDKDQIFYKKVGPDCCCHCKCERSKYSSENLKVDILKIEHNSPRETYKAEMVQRSETLPDCNRNESNSDILDKLSSLHNGLLLKQEQWENSPTTPSLSSSIRH